MLTVNPRDQKKLVQDIKTVDRPVSTLTNSANQSQDTSKAYIKPEYNLDTQLSATDIDKSKEYSMIPEEVGYVTKFPVSGHVQTWLYVVVIPVYALQIYSRTNANYKQENYSVEATKNIFTDFSVYAPAFSILMILIIISCIYSHKTWIHYLGSFLAFLSFLVQSYILYALLPNGINLFDVTQIANEQGFTVLVSSNYYYSMIVTILLFFYSFLYFILPKYRTAYQ